MPEAVHTPGIVVGLVDYGEADRVVRFLSPDYGRISALARSAKRSKKRFAGSLDPGNRVELVLRRGRGELWHLDEAVLEDGRLHARQDLDRLAMMVYATELCGSLAREEHPEPRLYGLLDMALVVLDGLMGAPGEAFRLGIEAKALTFAGVAPSLDRCAVCGDLPGDETLAIAPGAGGLVHQRCHDGGLPVSGDWLEAVERARRTPLKELVDAGLPPGPAWALSDCIEWHLGRGLKSRPVLASVSVSPPAPTGG